MDSNPSGPPPVGRSAPAPSAQPDDCPQRYGTVTLTRQRKDDGRALILYSHAEDDPA